MWSFLKQFVNACLKLNIESALYLMKDYSKSFAISTWNVICIWNYMHLQGKEIMHTRDNYMLAKRIAANVISHKQTFIFFGHNLILLAIAFTGSS